MKHEPGLDIHMKSLGGPGSWVVQDLQGRANNVSQVDGLSDMAPACQLCGSVHGWFRKGAVASAYISV